MAEGGRGKHAQLCIGNNGLVWVWGWKSNGGNTFLCFPGNYYLPTVIPSIVSFTEMKWILNNPLLPV